MSTSRPPVDAVSPIGNLADAESLYTGSSAMAWTESKPGVFSKLLYEDESRKERTLLVRLDPEAKSAPHSHTEFEQIYVIEGSFDDGERVLTPGDFCVRSPGQIHTAHSPAGALVLVTYTGK